MTNIRLLELIDQYEANMHKIPVRWRNPDGDWETRTLDQVPAADALHHLCRLIRTSLRYSQFERQQKRRNSAL